MGNLPALDVAIGIVFFYALFALVCTTLNEAIARQLKKRPATLESAIRQLLGDDELHAEVMKHPLIRNLSPPKKNEKPSYIPAKTFATALVDTLTGEAPVRDVPALQTAVNTLPDDSRRVLNILLEKSEGDWNAFHAEVEQWYDNMMDRAQGWYKRYIQKQTYVLALVVVVWANFDTLAVARRLYTDSATRAAVVEAARLRNQEHARAAAQDSGGPLATFPDKRDAETMQAASTAADRPSAPITADEQALIASVTGWRTDIYDLRNRWAACNDARGCAHLLYWLLNKFLGLGLSILCVSLGAPFWFDVLNRFMNLRNTGRAPDEPRGKNAGGKKEGGQ